MVSPGAHSAHFLVGLLALTLCACVFGANGDRAKIDRERDIDIPQAERNRANPVPPSARSVEAGERLFSASCTPCHGEKGKGKGGLARQLELHPPNLASAKHQATRTDGDLFYILTRGHDGMPAQGDRWTDEVKWDLVNYIRSLAR